MASEFIAIEIQGVEEVKEYLRRLPLKVVDAAVDAASKYLINVLHSYPPYKYVSRKAAYGQTFVSDKQRRWFFAALNSGELSIPYHRTQTLSKAWKQIGSGATSFIANETPYAWAVVGPGEQSRHARMIGWKSVQDTADEHAAGMIRRADAAVDKVLK